MTEAMLKICLEEIIEEYTDDEELIKDVVFDLVNFISSSFDMEV